MSSARTASGEKRRRRAGGSANRITITDVARLADVSIKTVSRVVNRDPTVGAPYRKAVERAVEELGYRPNISARALAGQRSYLIGLFSEKLWPNYISLLQMGAMEACRAAGFHLVVEQVGNDPSDLADSLRRMVAFASIDGLIVPPPLCDNETVLATLADMGVPFVRIAPTTFAQRTPCVTMDDRRAAYEMTAYLWDRGHRDIGFVAPPANHVAATRRLEGFRSALGDRGSPIRPDYVVEGEFVARSGMEAGLRLLALDRPPTAIFAANDEMAAGVMIAAYQRGLSLPRDLSVAGFDDSPVAQSVHPLLTTIRQPTAEMARHAAEYLIAGQGEAEKLLDFELIVRGSVGPGPYAEGG